MALKSDPRPGSSIFHNYFWSLLNLGVSKGLRFAGIVLCVRQIGIINWGQVASALVAVTFIGFLVDQGLSGTPQVYKVQDRSLDWVLVRTISRYRFTLAVIVISLLHVGRIFWAFPSALVLTYSYVLLARSLAIDWIFHRREKYHLTLLINTVRTVVFFSLVALVLAKKSTPATVIAIEIASETIGLIFSYALVGRLGISADSIPGRLPLKALLLFSLPILLTGTMDTALGSADILVLKSLTGYDETGQYDIGGKIGMFYFFLGATLIQIILPKLARLHAAADVKNMREILAATGKILLLLGTALLIPSFYFARELVTLFFKQDNSLTIFVFQWIPIWVYVTPLTMLNVVVLLATNRRKDYLIGGVLAAAVNVGANFAMISFYGGRGAVFARFASESVLLVYSFSRLPQDFRIGQLRDYGIHFGNLALQIIWFRLYAGFGHRDLFLALSILSFIAIVLFQRTVSRKTFDTLVLN